MSHDRFYFDEAQLITDDMREAIDEMVPVHPYCRCQIVRRSWYKRHELAIWLTLVALLAAVFGYLLFHAQIWWDITDPFMKYLGGN